MATADQILACRRNVGDVDIALPILSDDEYTYFIDSTGSVSAGSIQAAKTILFKLSINSIDKTVDILSVKGSKAAEAYRLALELYLNNPYLNPILNNISGSWIGNTSISEMQANIDAPDNYVSPLAVPSQFSTIDNDSSNPFSI